MVTRWYEFTHGLLARDLLLNRQLVEVRLPQEVQDVTKYIAGGHFHVLQGWLFLRGEMIIVVTTDSQTVNWRAN
jgi:hypothetical protein